MIRGATDSRAPAALAPVAIGLALSLLAAVEHPCGRTLGLPGDHATQREVLRAALQLLADATTPGEVRHLPFRWPEPRGQAMRFGHAPPPITGLIKRKPWLYLRFVAGKIPE